MLNESDEDITRMERALEVFEITINGEFFHSTPIIIIFNKEDVLKTKISKKDTLKDRFPEYTKGQDFDEAKSFIVNMFLSKIRGDRSRFKIFIKKAINIDDVREVFSYIEHLSLSIKTTRKLSFTK